CCLRRWCPLTPERPPSAAAAGPAPAAPRSRPAAGAQAGAVVNPQSGSHAPGAAWGAAPSACLSRGGAQTRHAHGLIDPFGRFMELPFLCLLYLLFWRGESGL
ncbi:hypothetical protein KIL84_010748, partial [Mauremys mutica]